MIQEVDPDLDRQEEDTVGPDQGLTRGEIVIPVQAQRTVERKKVREKEIDLHRQKPRIQSQRGEDQNLRRLLTRKGRKRRKKRTHHDPGVGPNPKNQRKERRSQDPEVILGKERRNLKGNRDPDLPAIRGTEQKEDLPGQDLNREENTQDPSLGPETIEGRKKTDTGKDLTPGLEVTGDLHHGKDPSLQRERREAEAGRDQERGDRCFPS